MYGMQRSPLAVASRALADDLRARDAAEGGRRVLWADASGAGQFDPRGYARLVSTNGGPISLPKWRKALGNTLAGTANSRILFIGDSTSAGIQPSLTGKFGRSVSSVMARILSRSLAPVNANAAFGDPTRTGGTTLTNYDGRWATAGTAWATLTGFSSAGGNAFGNSTTTATLAHTPSDPVTGAAYSFDQIDIYSCTNTGYGTWTVNVDGGATLATVNDNGTRALRKTTVSCTLGTHTINIARNGTGGQVFILGIVVRNTAVNAIEVLNFAAGSYGVADMAGDAGDFTFGGCVDNIAPHLTFIDIGINDRRLGAYTSAFDTALRALVARCLVTGDVVLCKPVPSQLSFSAYTTLENQLAFDAAIDAVAAANRCRVYSKRSLLRSYELGQPDGWYSDGLHPAEAAYAAIGLELADIARL